MQKTFYFFGQSVCQERTTRYNLYMLVYQPSSKKRVSRRDSSLAQQAYILTKEKILMGDLPTGTALSRRKLAEEYKMSFVPVMEALQKLETEGLVESRSRVGTRVRVPTPGDIREEYIMREALECHCARLFAEKATLAEKRELRIIARELDNIDEKWVKDQRPNREVVIAENRLHMHIHMRIAECTGSSALVASVTRNQTLVFKWLLDAGYKPPSQPYWYEHWHEDLVEELSVSDPDKAEAAMRHHILHGLDAVMDSLQPSLNAAYSEWKRKP
jgi:DNA-binding GntR family transcriptional regulator